MPHISYQNPPKSTVIHKTHCCGIMEIDYLAASPAPVDVLRQIGAALWMGAGGLVRQTSKYSTKIVTFSAVVGRRVASYTHDGSRETVYGQNFANFITENNLGTVISTEPVVNWTGNSIKLWAWTINQDTIWPFLKKNSIPFGPETKGQTFNGEEVEVEELEEVDDEDED